MRRSPPAWAEELAAIADKLGIPEAVEARIEALHTARPSPEDQRQK